MKIGIGKDIHALKEGLKLKLGGVEIPFNKGLESYSDGDVVLHALCDAILGALGKGDIGLKFPDNDLKNKNRSSVEFLKEIANLLENRIIENIDIFISCEKPKLYPYYEEMKKVIKSALNNKVNQINIKAGTNEGFGPVGEGKAIEAYAVVLIND